MISDTNVGGNITTINEVSDNQKMTFFSPEFKQETACLVLDQGYTIPQASVPLGIGESIIRRWLIQLADMRDGVTPKSKALTPEQSRIQELEARCKRLEQEKDMLRFAVHLLLHG
jgi:transposase